MTYDAWFGVTPEPVAKYDIEALQTAQVTDLYSTAKLQLILPVSAIRLKQLSLICLPAQAETPSHSRCQDVGPK